MECDFSEKVSLLIDGALAEDEAARVTAHVAGCDACRASHAAFLRLREELRAEGEVALRPADELRALGAILSTARPPLWRRRVSLPVPALAALVALVVALGAAALRPEPAAGTAAPDGRMALYVVKRVAR